jgi:hypothetical protein
MANPFEDELRRRRQGGATGAASGSSPFEQELRRRRSAAEAEANAEPSTLRKIGNRINAVLDTPSDVLTQTAVRLAGIGESEETKRRYQGYADQVREKFAPKNKKLRESYETTKAIASLPAEIAKYAAVSVLGTPVAAAALGAAEAAGGLKEESSVALAKTLAEKANAPRVAQTLGAINETALGRGLFDVGLGVGTDFAFRGIGAVSRGLRGKTRTADMVGDAFSEGMREGAGEAFDVATPSLASNNLRSGLPMVPQRGGALAPMPTPTAPSGAAYGVRGLLTGGDPLDAIPEAEFEVITGRGLPGPRVPMGPAGSTGGPFTPPMAPTPPFVQVGKSRPTRIPAPGAALPPEGLAAGATPDDIAQFLKKPTKKRVAAAEARAQQQGAEEFGLTPERAAFQRALDEADDAMRGGDAPPGYEDIPITKLDELGYPDSSLRLKESELDDLSALDREAGRPFAPTLPAVMRSLSDRQLAALETRAQKRLEQAVYLDEWANTTGLEINQAGGNMRDKNKTLFNQYNEKIMDNGKPLLPPKKYAEEVRRNGAYYEDELGYAMEQHGMSPEDYHAHVSASKFAMKDAQKARAEMERVQKELARRGRTEDQMRPRAGAVDPRVAAYTANPILGAAAGAALPADEGDTQTRMQRALAGAALGAGATYGGMKLLNRGATPKGPRGSTPALQFINEGINVGERDVKEADRLLTGFQRFRSQVVSETLPLEIAAEKGGGASARKAVSESIAQFQGAGQSARQYLDDRIEPIIKNLSEQELDDARALIKARRLVNNADNYENAAQKAEGSLDVWRQAVADGEANPRVKAAADAVTEMHKNLLDMRYEAGLLSDEAYLAIQASEDYYTPFVREFVDDVEAGVRTLPGSKTGRFNVFTSGVRKMDRSVESLANTADPFEVSSAAVVRAFRDTRKQAVNNTLLDMADNGALPFVRQVKADPTKPLAPNQFQQIRNGKVRIYQVDDPDLYKAIAGQDERSRNFMVQLAQGLKQVKTAGVVLNPAFAAFNVIRDVAASGIQRPDLMTKGIRDAGTGALVGGATSVAVDDERDAKGLALNFLRGAGLGAGAGLYARPFAQTMQAASKILKNDDLYKEFLRQGGSTEGFYVRNPKDAQQILKEMRKTGVDLKTIVNPKSWVDALRFIGSVGEQSTRLAAYKQMRDAGATPLEAIVNAQDRTLRFANVGSATKGLASMTPFWNAKVQGWDKLIRMLGKKETYAAGFAMLTAPTLALWSVNKDNPAYWERPQWERNLFWLVPLPDGEDFVRIPKPFELGQVFASSFERMADYAAQRGLIDSAAPRDADPERALGRAAFDAAASTFEGTLPVPEFLSTPLQAIQGRDWFRNRDIVTRPDLPTRAQGNRETSALARALGQAGISPEKTDFVVKSTLGTAGDEALRLSTAAARGLGADVPESDQGVPVAGLFNRRFVTQERGQTESEIAARDRLRELGKPVAEVREALRSGDRAAAQALMEENYADLAMYEQLKPLQTMLDKQVALRRQVEKDVNLSREDRQSMLAILRDRSAEISRAIIEAQGGGR